MPMGRVDRRSEILDAATRIILRDGIDGIRSAAVAQEAGVSAALPHYYFPTLDDLVRATFEHVRADVRPQDGTAPLARLRALLDHAFSGSGAAVDRAWSLRTEFHRHAVFDADLRAQVVAAEEDWIAQIAGAVRALQGEGAAPTTADADRIGQRLASLVVGLGVFRLIGIVTTDEARTRIEAALEARGGWTTGEEGRVPLDVRLPLSEPPSDRRAAVLNATIRVIARDGVAGVHFPEVAEEAGVSASLPRYYFATIPALIAGAFDHDAALSRTLVVQRAAAIPDPIDRLRDAYADQIALDPEGRRATWTLWAEYLRLAGRDMAERARARQRLEDWIEYDRATIREAQTAGLVVASVDAGTAALDLSAILNGAGALWLAGVLDVPDVVAVTDAAIDDTLEIMFQAASGS